MPSSPSTTARVPSPPASSRWHSIRPQLSLTVREITSVSLVLAWSIRGLHPLKPSLSTPTSSTPTAGTSPAKLLRRRHRTGSDDGDADAEGDDSGDSTAVEDELGLAGVAVSVNGLPWKQAHLAHVGEEEAVLVVYGLGPGIEYNVELKWLGRTGSEAVRTDGAGAPASSSSTPDPAGAPLLDALPISSSGTPQPARSRAPSSSALLPPLEAQLASLLTTRDALAAELKKNRREAQRHGASLQSEIDALKRALERTASADQRGRQKVLALQEAIKRALAAGEELEAQAQEVGGGQEALERDGKAVESEWGGVVEQGKASDSAAREVLGQNRKAVEGREAELSALTARLEKLLARRDKLEKDTLPETEDLLAQLHRDVEAMELEARFAPPRPPPPPPMHHAHLPPHSTTSPFDYAPHSHSHAHHHFRPPPPRPPPPPPQAQPSLVRPPGGLPPFRTFGHHHARLARPLPPPRPPPPPQQQRAPQQSNFPPLPSSAIAPRRHSNPPAPADDAGPQCALGVSMGPAAGMASRRRAGSGAAAGGNVWKV